MRLPSERIALAKKAGMPKRMPAFTGSEPCKSVGPEPFLADDQHPKRSELALLREICESCPMLQECFTWAIHREPHYFWAGTSSAQRKIIRQLNRIPLRDPSA